jgi:hypothetical protein
LRPLLFSLLLFLVSCSSRIEVITPSSNFTLPEANGEFANFDLNINQSNGSLLAILINDSTGAVTSTTTTSTLAYGGNLNFGFSKYIDFYAKASTHSPHLFGVKIQLKGSPKNQAESKNFSVAFNMGIGQNKYAGAGAENFGIQLGSSDYSLNRTHTSIEMGVSVGYRFIKEYLTYLNIEKLSENVHGQIKYEDNPSDNKSMDISGEHMQYTMGVMYFYEVYNWGAEIAFQQMAWESSNKVNSNTLNLLFGKNF